MADRCDEAARRLDGLGVGEHVWSHIGPPGSGMVTGIVDQTFDAHGLVHTRLLDLVLGRFGEGLGRLAQDRGTAFTAGIKTAALDPFRGCANAIRDELPEAITVLDAFQVKLGSAMEDEVRRRVQQDTHGPHTRGGSPHGICGTLHALASSPPHHGLRKTATRRWPLNRVDPYHLRSCPEKAYP